MFIYVLNVKCLIIVISIRERFCELYEHISHMNTFLYFSSIPSISDGMYGMIATQLILPRQYIKHKNQKY